MEWRDAQRERELQDEEEEKEGEEGEEEEENFLTSFNEPRLEA